MVVEAVQVGAVGDEGGHGFGVPVVGGQHEQGVALVVGEVDRQSGAQVLVQGLALALACVVEHAGGQFDDVGGVVGLLVAHMGEPSGLVELVMVGAGVACFVVCGMWCSARFCR